MFRSRSWTLALLTLGLVGGLGTLRAERAPGPLAGGLGLQERVDQIMARDRAARPAFATGARPPRSPRRRSPVRLAALQSGSQSPAPPAQPLAAERLASPKSAQSEGANFLGTDTAESGGVYPLDAMGSAGTQQIVVFTNALVKVFSKAGVLDPTVLGVTTDNFFGSVRGASSTTDVRVRYDPSSQKWFLTCLNGDMGAGGGVNNSLLIAVSDGAVITPATVFTFFNVPLNTVSPAGDNNLLADSDSLGIDKFALYVGVNLFSFNAANNSYAFVNSSAFVIQKASLLSGGPVVATAFRDLINTGTGAGPYLPQGVDNQDPGATFGFLVAVDNLNSGVWIVRIANPGSAGPTIDQSFNVAVPTYGNSLGDDLGVVAGSPAPLGVPVQGSNPGLDDLDNRLTVAQIMGGSLWTVHNIDVDSSGNAILTNPPGPNRDGARWYQFGNLTSILPPASPPILSQSGTLVDPTGTGSSYFVPTLAVSGQGHMAIGATRGGPAEHAQAVVAGRWASDLPGTLQTPLVVQSSTTSYNFDVNVAHNPNLPPQRWGDYSYTGLDPVDQMSIWTFQEFCNTTDSMGVQVTQLLAPSPATPSSVVPTSADQGLSSVVVNLTGSSSSGSAFYDPGTGLITASVTGGVVVKSVTFNSSTQITLTLDTTGAALGPQSITVTNPDGQSMTGADLLTITSPAAGAPVVTQVTSPAPNGSYGAGAVIPVLVAFSKIVTVAGGTPTLALSSGATVSYSGGSGNATLVFDYTVAVGDTTNGLNLDEGSTQALVLNGATIQNGGQNATLTLPAPGAAGSLGANKSLVINAVPPPPTGSSGGGGGGGCGSMGLDGLLLVALLAGASSWSRRSGSGFRASPGASGKDSAP